MKRSIVLKLVLCLFIPFQGYGQAEITFDEGLAAPLSNNYTRAAVSYDLILQQMINREFQSPADGLLIGENSDGETVHWQKIELSEEGDFRGQGLRSGYLYLSFEADQEKIMWLHASGHSMLFFNGVPRAGDIYGYGYLYLPVTVREGKNEILLRTARWGGVNARLVDPEIETGFLEGDPTLPHILAGEEDLLWGGVRIINSTRERTGSWQIKSTVAGNEIITDIPEIPAMTLRKVPFQFDPSGVGENRSIDLDIELIDGNHPVHRMTLQLNILNTSDHHSRTFISEIDGSIQYYSVAPQKGGIKEQSALFLSVHGAEVEAISQARAYQPKEWGTLVAPTNRRPRGFNWEDWGRMDALEVLEIAREKYRPDPQKIYLTGHSMGGHGTWYLGATYPEKWAAIAPAAGYPSLRMYGSHDGTVPDGEDMSPLEQVLLRASNPSDVMSLVDNYKAHGVYILHGDADNVVSVEHARTMRRVLAEFHPDFTYYEYPGGSHWYGDESVDWPPLFDFFKQREIPEPLEPNEISFITANPGISSTHRWASIDQQMKSLEFSRFTLSRDSETNSIRGETENVSALTLDISRFPVGENLLIQLDDKTPIRYSPEDPSQPLHLFRNGSQWSIGEPLPPEEKGPRRNGSFKEAFKDRMVFVYGSSGSDEENSLNRNKARYDAETWYYRGNGAVDLIPDHEFDPETYRDRSVILYGNRDNNSAWDDLLAGSPIEVTRHSVKVGDHRFESGDLGVYFVYPRSDSEFASVAVISGTGEMGMKSAWPNQYFAGGSGYPDFMIFTSSMLVEDEKGVVMAGFFDNEWNLATGDYILNTD